MTDQPQSPPRTREEVWERIRASSREEFIVEDMVRLGFWPKQGTLPQDPADEIRRRGELQRKLDELRTEYRRLHNETALLKELRQRRLAESRKKRQETKERRERERQERAEAWRKRKEHELPYLGEGVSGGLNHTQCNEERLKSYKLPLLDSAEQIAAAMGITVGRLRFLAYSRKVGTIPHYVRFRVAKKTGGHRTISAPMPRLKAAQEWILRHILDLVPVHEAAHGFRTGRSIVSNARPHIGAAVVLNLDLQDFFPTVEYRRVKGLFRSLGYSEAAATVFALICTEPDREEVELDGRRYFVAQTERHLPQGAPTSPAITNILCRRLDRRLAGLAAAQGFTYTRYADDLTFSAGPDRLGGICNVLKGTASIVAHEGFQVHPAKTRVLRRARRQEVTGVIVNLKANVCRDTLRRFRATLYQIEKDGPAGKRWGQSSDVISAISGFANFVRMVNPEKGGKLQQQVQRIITKHGWRPPPTPRRGRQAPPAEPPPSTAAPTEETTRKKWWKLF